MIEVYYSKNYFYKGLILEKNDKMCWSDLKVWIEDFIIINDKIKLFEIEDK